MKKSKALLLFLLLGMLLSLTPAYARYNQTDSETILFYPDDILYVDRNQPTTYVGGESRVIIRDWFGEVTDPIPPYEADGTHYYDEVDAARAYMRFNTADLTSALNGYAIESATLVMYLNGMTDGNPAKVEDINVRQVTGASSENYIPGLTWDLQAPPKPQNSYQGRDITFGDVFATQSFGTNSTPGTRVWTQSDSHTLAQLVGAWKGGNVTNYGIVLENDWDGGWQELVNATLYSVNNPGEMDELETIFARGDSYPYLRVKVSVVPEPASCLLALLGMGAFGLAAKRRRA